MGSFPFLGELKFHNLLKEHAGKMSYFLRRRLSRKGSGKWDLTLGFLPFLGELKFQNVQEEIVSTRDEFTVMSQVLGVSGASGVGTRFTLRVKWAALCLFWVKAELQLLVRS